MSTTSKKLGRWAAEVPRRWRGRLSNGALGLSGLDRKTKLVAVAALLILLYGSLLRVGALTDRLGVVEEPEWLGSLQVKLHWVSQHLSPESFRLQPAEGPYRGDPVTYLRYAREMGSFYGARVREPVFVFSTKVFLWLTRDRDPAVSLASGFFSFLLLGATFLLGTQAFSPWVGLGAAAAVAIERRLVTIGVEGWRDDAFAFFVVLSTFALLRLLDKPTMRNAVAAGIVAGLSCLTRITSLSFLFPAFLFLLVSTKEESWTVRLRIVGVAFAVMWIVVGPFLVNCWIVYGDPFFSINHATRFYRERDNIDSEESMSWPDYLLMKTDEQGLVETTDEFLVGVTTYPFSNKWVGFAPWSRGLGQLLSMLAFVGLWLFIWSVSGRFLLVVLLASLIPYAFTWGIPGGAEFRFTMHAYPFYLIAAVFTAEQLVLLVLCLVTEKSATIAGLLDRRVIGRAAATVTLAAVSWTVFQVIPYWRLREDLARDEVAHVAAGPRDRLFFRYGWYPAVRVGNVMVRWAKGGASSMWIPMHTGRDYTLVIRAARFDFKGAARQRVRVSLNGSFLANMRLRRTRDRVGSYTFHVPLDLVHGGFNRIDFNASYSTKVGSVQARSRGLTGDQDVSFMIWYVNVSPNPS